MNMNLGIFLPSRRRGGGSSRGSEYYYDRHEFEGRPDRVHEIILTDCESDSPFPQ